MEHVHAALAQLRPQELRDQSHRRNLSMTLAVRGCRRPARGSQALTWYKAGGG